MMDTRQKRLTTDVNEFTMSKPMIQGRRRGPGTVAGKKALANFDESDEDEKPKPAAVVKPAQPKKKAMFNDSDSDEPVKPVAKPAPK